MPLLFFLSLLLAWATAAPTQAGILNCLAQILNQPTDFAVASSDAPANLITHPDLISPYDRTLLRDAKYIFPDDGTVRDLSQKALTSAEILEVLQNLRAARKQEALAALARVQQEFLNQGGVLKPNEAYQAQAILARDWEAFPPDIRDGMNEILKRYNYKPVRNPDLSAIKRAGREWTKTVPDIYDAAATQIMSDGMPSPPEGLESRIRNLEAQMARISGEIPVPRSIGTRSPKSILNGIDEAKVFGRPSPEVVETRLHEIDGTSYSDHVKNILRNILRYAPDQDAEAVLRVVRNGTPIIISNEKMVPFSNGSASWPDGNESPEEHPPRVVLPEYLVFAPGHRKGEEVKLPHPDPRFYEKLGLPVPSVEALDPAAKPVKVSKKDGVNVYEFRDGSRRKKFSPEAISGLLEHELLHIDTYLQGAGANSFTNEMRSFLAMGRFWFNRDESNGRTKESSYGDQWTWLRNPITFRNDILQAYISPEVGEIRADEITVEQQLARNARTLAVHGEEFERLRTEEMDKRFKRQTQQRLAVVKNLEQNGFLRPDQATIARDKMMELEQKERSNPDNAKWDYRKDLLWERERLIKDQELEQRILLDDWKWHTARGLAYRELAK